MCIRDTGHHNVDIEILLHLKRHATTTGREDNSYVYNHRMAKVVGIFSTMVALTAINYTPVILLFLVGVLTGKKTFNSVYNTGVVVIYCFRKEQQEFIIKTVKNSSNFVAV